MLAGPSRARPSPSPVSAGTPSDDEDTEAGQSQSSETRRRKRPRTSLRDELFERQDRDEKQRIGQGYRDLQTTADDMKTNLENIGAGDLARMVREQNKLFRDVRDTSLATLDARLIMTTTETAANLIRKMKLGGSTFDVDEFLIRIKGVLGLDRAEAEDLSADEEDEEMESDVARREQRLAERARKGRLGDWEKIGWMAASLYRRVPGVEFMYGPLSVQHQKRTVARRQKAVIAPELRPQELETQTKDRRPKDITVANVKEISKTLERLDPEGKGVNFFRLVVNPHDFGQTVENVFYTSFLVRDGRVGIRVEDDGEIMISRREPHDVDRQGDIPRNQAVLELDMAVWKDAIELFNITESAIPHRRREDHSAPSANQWYT